MTNLNVILEQIKKHELDEQFKDIYYDDEQMIAYQNNRYYSAIQKYAELFGEGDIEIYSAPGRTEVCGNHTDHQNGMVLAASINLDAIAIVGANDQPEIKILSEGYPLITVDLNDIDLNKEEEGSTTALIKGVINGMKERGLAIGPFKAYITSDVLSGSGLSSSAAFEAMIGTIISGLFNNMSVSPIEIAKIGQYAENVYFGKPCGLMDQMACSVGGFVNIDFKDPEHPVVNKVDFDISEVGYSLCIVDTKGSHADLTEDYALVPAEMNEVAAFFGKEHLSEVDKEEFLAKIPALSGKTGDRAILRSFHFFNENERVQKAVDALKENRFGDFLEAVKDSGNSSYKYLQNVYSNKHVQTQSVPITLALSEYILENNGVSRVHGGGFAGTIQAFVKNSFVSEYKQFIENVLGEGSCHVLKIRKYGGIKIK